MPFLIIYYLFYALICPSYAYFSFLILFSFLCIEYLFVLFCIFLLQICSPTYKQINISKLLDSLSLFEKVKFSFFCIFLHCVFGARMWFKCLSTSRAKYISFAAEFYTLHSERLESRVLEQGKPRNMPYAGTLSK